MKRAPLITGAAGTLIVLLFFLLVDPHRALAAWLMAWGYAASIAVGALILVMLMNAANARWFIVYRRLGETLAGMLVPLAVLFVPILLGARLIYPWVTHPIAAKRAYLNLPFWSARSLVYLGLFAVVALVLRKISIRQDNDPDVNLVTRQRVLSSALLPPVCFALTFGAIDWFMSLEPTWYSEVYGIYWWAGGFVSSIALLVFAGFRWQPAARPTHFYALGRLALAFVIFWAYIAYAQGFIIWIGNKPAEVTWYVTRSRGSWGGMGVLLGFAHFVIPFALLLSRRLKYSPSRLKTVCGLILVAHLIDVYWVIMPALDPTGFHPSPVDLAALAGVLGLCAAFAPIWLRGTSKTLLPDRSPFLPVALAYDAGMTAGGDDAPPAPARAEIT